MNELKLKVCGMRDADNIEAVASLHPDYMGFIFYPLSPRFVGNEFAVPEALPDSVTRVGVFVDESYERIMTIAKANRLTAIQLHGKEAIRDCAMLRESGFTVIKAFAVHDQMDFQSVSDYESAVDFVLFDAKGRYHGGNAKVFDWQILSRYDQRIPFFLSGGLSLSNVTDVRKISGLNLHALDVNSGVEDEPGRKNMNKLTSFIHQLGTIR